MYRIIKENPTSYIRHTENMNVAKTSSVHIFTGKIIHIADYKVILECLDSGIVKSYYIEPFIGAVTLNINQIVIIKTYKRLGGMTVTYKDINTQNPMMI